MLCYDINSRGETPIYEFLYNCIRDDIQKGRLKAGSKLPSKRELAADNGIALITVENAYAQLIIEGYVEARQRRGYFVSDDIIPVNLETQARTANSEMVKSEMPSSDKKAGNGAASVVDSIKYDFVHGGLIYDSFPYSIWAKLMRRVISFYENDFTLSPPSEGVGELRCAIAEYLQRVKGLVVDPSCIVIGPGTEYLHSVILQILGRNRLVAVEDPGYKKAGLIYESNGMKVVHIPLDEEGIEVDKLEASAARLLHISPAHHFPTGIVMSASRRNQLIKWADEHLSYIIEDDYDSEFRFKGRPVPPMMSINSDRIIYMNTFTGTLAPSIRIAYMVLPDELSRVYHEKLSFLSGTVSTFEQLTLAEFISEGYYERHIGRMRNKYKELRNRYKEVAEDYNDLRIEEDPAGLQMILNLSSVIEVKRESDTPFNLDKRIIDRLMEHGIKITPMSDYCYRYSEKYAHRFVMKYMVFSESEIHYIYDKIIMICKEC